MRKGFFAALVLFSMTSAIEYSGTVSRGGLSGFPHLPGGGVIHHDRFRLQSRLKYVESGGRSGDLVLIPLNGTWGFSENLELGGEVPLYLDDGSKDVQVLGDVTVSCGWIYETARGGSILALNGTLRLPPAAREGTGAPSWA